MFLIFRHYDLAAKWVFGISLLSLLTSLIYSFIEIILSTKAIDVELSDMELKRPSLLKHLLDEE
jgi:hypothetical protein